LLSLFFFALGSFPLSLAAPIAILLTSKSKSRQSLLSHLIRSMADLPSPSSSAADDDAVVARLAAAAHVPLDRARFFFEAAGGDEGVALRMMQGAKEDY
jgi:hypothetical protein